MTFDPRAIHPVARHPITGNIYWFYIQITDTVAEISADAYFNALNTGMSVNDLIAVIGGDGTADLKISAIDGGTNDVTTVGGAIDIADVLVDGINEPILPDIGGTVVPSNLREALERIHQRLNLKVQTFTGIGSGFAVLTGKDSSDPSSAALIHRRLAAGTGIEINVVNDTLVITNTAPDTSGGGSGGGGSGGTGGSLIPPPPANFGFENGTRLLYVTQNTSNNPIGGETATQKFTTIQAALNAAQPDDVVLVRSDVYREFPLTMNNKTGPIWIVAEERGQARISALWSQADNGTQTWTDDGGGVFFASRGSRPYIGAHDDDFLMAFLTEADLKATTVQGVTKPTYGFAFVNGESRVYVRLRGNQNPNGQSVKLTNSISQRIMEFDNCDNIILDGFLIEGAGNTHAVQFNANCANPLVRNCIFTHGRRAVRTNGSGATLSTCEYKYTGFGEWCAEVLTLDGKNNNGPFTLLKNYYTGAAIGVGGGATNALLEGSIDGGQFGVSPVNNLTIDLCLLGPCFDGANIGRFTNSEILRTVFLQCRDDGTQMEGSGSSAQVGTDNEVHDCKFIDCFVGTSHQNETIGPNYVYRCVFQNLDARFRHNTLYMLKMLSSETGLLLHHYHNLYENRADAGAANQFIWYDFGNGTGNRIRNFLNNIVMYTNTLTNGSGPNPGTISGNAVVSPSAGNASFLTGGGGVYAGSAIADMDLDTDLGLLATSPARGIGTTLPGGFPDSRSGANANDDAGPFPFGESPGENWPRETTTTFDLNPPSQFA